MLSFIESCSVFFCDWKMCKADPAEVLTHSSLVKISDFIAFVWHCCYIDIGPNSSEDTNLKHSCDTCFILLEKTSHCLSDNSFPRYFSFKFLFFYFAISTFKNGDLVKRNNLHFSHTWDYVPECLSGLCNILACLKEEDLSWATRRTHQH